MLHKEMIEKHISVNPEIQHSKPCIKGTRTPVHVILEALATGMNLKQVKTEFSPITTEDVNACMLYAAFLADEQELIVQPAV